MSGDGKHSGRRLEIVPGCIICKTCEFMAADVFCVPEKGLTATVLVEEPPEERIPDVLEAVRNCPEHVIKFRKKG